MSYSCPSMEYSSAVFPIIRNVCCISFITTASSVYLTPFTYAMQMSCGGCGTEYHSAVDIKTATMAAALHHIVLPFLLLLAAFRVAKYPITAFISSKRGDEACGVPRNFLSSSSSCKVVRASKYRSASSSHSLMLLPVLFLSSFFIALSVCKFHESFFSLSIVAS